jgi:hypothetical protein
LRDKKIFYEAKTPFPTQEMGVWGRRFLYSELVGAEKNWIHLIEDKYRRNKK